MIHNKTYIIPYIVIIIATGTGCKKDTQGGGALPPQTENKVIVSTIAGDGTKGFANGPALSAKFNSPIDVAVANDGTIYVADFTNHRIRKIAGGQVSTFAGNGTFGIVNSTGDRSQFKFPSQIALDAGSNLYILDEGNPTIRQITPTADVAVFAGTYNPGFLNGSALIAQFQVDAESVVADAQGNIYIGDTFNNRIRKIGVDGEVSTLAGNETEGFRDGDAATAQFRYPGGIAFDRQGNLFVADEGNFCIRKITPDRVVLKFAGSGQNGNADGNAASAQFNFITDMVADSLGNLFIADDNRIRKVTPQGIVSTIAGSTVGYVDGDGDSAKFAGIGGLGIDVQGNIYVADIQNNRIRKISFQ